MPYDDEIYDSPALTVAEDANYEALGNVYDGTPTKVVPAAGQIRQWSRPDGQLAGQHNNWIMRQFALLVAALKDDGERVEDDLIAFRDVDHPAEMTARSAEWERRFGRMQALNWSAPVTHGVAGPRHAHFWVDRWYVIGTTEWIRYSLDQGNTWTTDLAAQAALGSETLCWMTSSWNESTGGVGDNRILIATTHADRKVAYFDGAAWTKYQLPSSAPIQVGYEPRVAFDPVHGKWFFIAVASDTTIQYAITDDPGTNLWETWLFPGGTEILVGTHLLPRIAVRPDTGRIIVSTYHVDDDRYCFVKSDDGGATWQDLAQVAATLGGGDLTAACLVFNPHDESWICTYNCTTEQTGQVLRSTDNGATWTVMKTFTASALGDVACLDGCLVSTAVFAGQNVIVYSYDNGATWKWGQVAPNTLRGAYAGAGRAFALGAVTSYMGLAAGTPPAITLA